MKSTTNLYLWILFTVVLFLSQITAGCTGEPVFVESGTPESRIIVRSDARDRCDFTSPEDYTFTTHDTRTRETSWYVEGKAGVGGKIPLGFLMPTVDIEAAITSHYGAKETRTWNNTASEAFTLPAHSKFIYVTYYQETTEKGIMRVYDKEIEYEYPAEVLNLGSRLVEMGCGQSTLNSIMCADLSGGAPVEVPASVANLVGTWRRSSPEDGEIVKVDVAVRGVNVIIHVQTNGATDVADWGEQYQCIWTDRMEVTFHHLIYRTTTLTLREGQDGDLQLTAVDRYIDPPVFIPAQTTEYIFTRQ